MKYIVIILILISTAGYAQIPKNANAIEVKGVSFRDAVSRLLDSNYSIRTMDSSFGIIETAPKSQAGNTSTLILKVRIKDSIATVTGSYKYGEKTDFVQGSIGWFMAGKDNAVIYRKGDEKRRSPFRLMNNYALSFNKPTEYKAL